MDTPSSVLYDDLKRFGIKNNDAAQILLNLDMTCRAGSKTVTMRDRIEDRTFLSREVVHAAPGQLQPHFIADMAGATMTIASRLARSGGTGTGSGGAKARTRESLAAHYGGAAAQAMIDALEQNGIDGAVYRNALERISCAPLPNERSRGVLYLMLFTGTGCYADPARAAEIVERFAKSRLAQGLYTTEMDVDEQVAGNAETERTGRHLGLLRMVGNKARGAVYPLSMGPEGTVIGALASGACDIADVDRDVSRRHLRIHLDKGHWYAQGLGSTNGSSLVSGLDQSQHVIEPPRGARTPGTTYPPVEIEPGDLLRLGATTSFLVFDTAVRMATRTEEER